MFFCYFFGGPYFYDRSANRSVGRPHDVPEDSRLVTEIFFSYNAAAAADATAAAAAAAFATSSS